MSIRTSVPIGPSGAWCSLRISAVMNARFLRSTLAAVVLAVMAGPGCWCRKPTDEELLRKKLDANPTYLYLAVKTAIHPKAKDADARQARRFLLTVAEAARKGGDGSDALAAKDAASLAVALWKLRGIGKDALRTWKPDPPPPVLAPLLEEMGKLEGGLDALLDGPTEHALLLAGLTVLKVHPKFAVPIPEELLLYEARYAKADELTIGGLESMVHALRAYTFGGSGLCDLAAADAKAVDSDAGGGFAKASKKLVGIDLTLGKKDEKELTAALTVLASGSTAICYVQRKEPKKAIEHLRKMLDAADELGIQSDATKLLRGLVECADGNEKKGRKILTKLRDETKDESTKKSVREMLDHCDASLLGTTRLGLTVGFLAFEHLERSSVLDKLADTPLVRAIAGLGAASSLAIEKVKGEIPDARTVEKKLFDW